MITDNGGEISLKLDLDVCEDEGLDALDDCYSDSPSTYQLEKLGADPCDDYWEELAS